MKQLCITYHMECTGEIAETCVTISVTDGIAESILAKQGRSCYVHAYDCSTSSIKLILNELAYLQGYSTATFCCAEEVPKP